MARVGAQGAVERRRVAYHRAALSRPQAAGHSGSSSGRAEQRSTTRRRCSTTCASSAGSAAAVTAASASSASSSPHPPPLSFSLHSASVLPVLVIQVTTAGAMTRRRRCWSCCQSVVETARGCVVVANSQTESQTRARHC